MNDLCIDLKRVAIDKEALIASTMAQISIECSGMLTLGDLLSKLPLPVVQYFVLSSDGEITNNFERDMVAATMVAMTVEGLPINEETIESAHKSLYMLMLLESMYRKGLIMVQKQNWSLGEDATNLPVASISDRGMDVLKRRKSN